MTTSLAQVDSLSQIQTGLEAFELRKEKVTALAEATKELELSDWKDKKSLAEISTQRKALKAERVAITKEGKGMRDLIAPINKHILSKEKELVDILEPEENRLQKLEDWAADEAEKERQAEIEKERQRIQKRIDALAEFGYQIDFTDVSTMTDDTFEKYLEAAKVQHEKEEAEKAEAARLEAERIEQERIEKEKEAEALRKEREELEKIRAEQAETKRKQDEAQAKIDAENKRIADEKEAAEQARIAAENEAKRQQELKEAAEKAAEAARLQAIQDAKDADAKRIEDERKAKELEAKKAARLPDRIKIEKYLQSLIGLNIPDLKTDEGKHVITTTSRLLKELIEIIKPQLNEL